jgi:hypothetical protein
MSGINFLSENLVDDATITITTGAANAQFPVLNLLNESPSNKFRSTGDTVVLEFDLAQTRDIDTIALVGDPTGTFGVTDLIVKTSVTTDFSGSTPISINLDAERNIGWSFITEVSHRFVEMTFTGTGSFSEVSNIFIGKRINLPQNNLSLGSFRYGYTDKSVARGNDYGQQFIDTRNKIKFISGGIEYATKDEHETLDDMFIRHGRHLPLWMIVDPDSEGMNFGAYKLAIYGYLLRSPRWSASGGQTYNANLRVTEAI